MSGKSYTMREMKSIVDYLTENHLYSETRGRKMWMDFANSNLTQRTWQSLKETFLKRVLPEITNPYYRLDPEQIMSFKRGVDLTQKNRKLEIKPVDESKNNGVSEHNSMADSSKHTNEENATGEDTQCSKLVHNRASTETLILDSCYQTAEEIQQDLESSGDDGEKSKKKSEPPIKSVRDFIEYTEPLTPMLQEVMDDFATDEECSDSEQPMQIDENYVAQDEIFDVPANPTSQSILNPDRTQNLTKPTITEDKDIKNAIINGELVSENNEKPVKRTDDALSQLEDVMVLVDEALAKDIEQELGVQKGVKINKEASSFESSIQLTDSLLPNNQEAIKNTSTVAVQSPAPPTPNNEVNSREENTINRQIDTNPPNSKSHLISDEEPDQNGPEGIIPINSNKDKTNIVEPLYQNTAQTTSSQKNVSDDKVHEIHLDSSTSNQGATPQADNPCLKSVRLYAEQLVTTKYSDSDSKYKGNANEQKTNQIQNNVESKEQKKGEQNNDEINGQEDQQNAKRNLKGKPAEGIIHLSSRTNSESVGDSEINHRPLARSSLKMRKDKKLASVFGFSNGGAAKSRRLNGRKRTISHHIVQSDSSDWTSASDSEYVSPPHGRRNRYARKYLKPRSTRIMSLEEEGGLFVMLGKKIYPLVKDGKKVKNYVTFLPESDPEEDESYWKSKYIQERKRTADLKKKLGHTKSNGVLEEKESSVSLSSVASPLSENPPNLPTSRQGSVQGYELLRRSSALEKSSNQETLKIKFTKNDQEVQLEGHWQHINPVLAQVVSMLHKEPAGKKKSETVTCVELSSGNNTPVDPPSVAGVHEKINELESEIFKEIEEKAVHEQVVEQKEDQENIQTDNAVEVNAVEISAEYQAQVTQRKKRGRPRKASPTPAAPSPAKKPKKSSEPSDAEDIKAKELLKHLSNEEKDKDSTPKVKRTIRSPRKLDDVSVTSKVKTNRRKSTLKVPEAPVEIQKTPAIEENLEEDDEVRYKFPSPAPEEDNKSTKTNKNSKESPKKHLPNIASPDSFSHHSVNSSQGYQDSDTSPLNIGIRKRKRLSVSSLSIKGRKMQRKRSRSYPLLKLVSDHDDSSSSISFKIVRRGETMNSEVYKSDSYQFLMANRQKLENIAEANNEMDSLTDRIRELRDELMQVNDNRNRTDAASSSILSLPLSPELSIVENISISKSAIAEISDIPTINEADNDTAPKTCNGKYLMSEVDVSMPLMTQNCELQRSYKKHLMAALSILSDTPNSAGRNLSNNSMNVSLASESILKNLSGVNVETSDSLDRRLEQLLLESAKKTVNQNIVENMEVDTQVKKKSGSRKRCSTPHKKRSVHNIKRITGEPVIIEEESKVQCSRIGRRSCPPTVNIVYCNQNPSDDLDISVNDESIDLSTITKRKGVKKDIIKVKIMKPKNKLQKKKSPKKTNASRNSRVAEGDNESGVFLQGFDDSSDLIHNHSETCLQIGDCMGESDSVEFIETTTKSIISLNSSSFNSDNKENVSKNSMESGKTSPELYCDNARCATNLRDATATEVRSTDSGNTAYFTPFVSRCNSALTEDLSNEESSRQPRRPSKWYLLSDEENNTNYFDVQENKDTPTYGSKLEQIFPVTCAIPDLSTITEMSANENSQKQSVD